MMARLHRQGRRAPRVRVHLGTESIRLHRLDGGTLPDGELGTQRDIRGANPAEAIELLQAELSAHSAAMVELRLGCAWNRLMLLPWSAQLTHEGRWLNLARARLEEVSGEDAATWDLRVARDLPGRPRLAAAWPAALRAQLASAPQVRSVRIELLEQLGILLERRARFTGCLAEIDGDRAGFVLLADGQARRVRASRFDANEGLVTAMRAEWAALATSDGSAAGAEPALALTPPEAAPDSPRARTAAALAGGLDFRHAFSIRESRA